MASRPDKLSPVAFCIDLVGVLTRHIALRPGLIRKVKVSLALVRFGEEAVAPTVRPVYATAMMQN